MKGIPLPALPPECRITAHCRKQAALKEIGIDKIEAAFHEPETEYPSGSHPGQVRKVRGGICIIVAEDLTTIVTVYLHCIQTELRPDQKGA